MAVKVKFHRGAYWLFIDYKGKRKAQRVGSEKAANDAAAKIQAKLTLGQFDIEDEEDKRERERLERERRKRFQFNTYFRNWLDTYVKAHCKARTVELYGQVFQRSLLPCFGQKDITAITREDVKTWAYTMLAQGKSRSTVKAALVPLRAMFSQAVDDGHVGANPAARILRHTRTEEGEQKSDFLTREEVARLLQTCRAYFPTHYPLFLLLVRTGLRDGEAFGLQWGDIDFNGRFIEVQRTWSNGHLSTPKNGKSRRVDMSLQLADTLKGLLLERKKRTLKKGWGEVPPWVFISETGTSLNLGNFTYRVWRPLLEKAGLRKIRIHDLRHTFASLLIQNGESLAYVKEQMGHHSIQLTVDTYGHLVPGGNKAAVDRLDDPEDATIRNPAATRTLNSVSDSTASA